MKNNELPNILITETADGWLHWHRITPIEKLLFEIYQKYKKSKKDNK